MKNRIVDMVVQACEVCSAKYCIGCKITVRKGHKRVVVNGFGEVKIVKNPSKSRKERKKGMYKIK